MKSMSPMNILPDEVYDKLVKADVLAILPTDRADEREAKTEAEYEKANEAIAMTERAAGASVDETIAGDSDIDTKSNKATDSTIDLVSDIDAEIVSDIKSHKDAGAEYLIAGVKSDVANSTTADAISEATGDGANAPTAKGDVDTAGDSDIDTKSNKATDSTIDLVSGIDAEVVSDIKSHKDASTEYLIAGVKTMYYLSGADVCHIVPQYRGNSGFFHVKCGSGQILLLKSCYDDHLRVIANGLPQELVDDDRSIEFSKILLNVEGVMDSMQESWFLFKPSSGELLLAHTQAYEFLASTEELSDVRIPRPLTSSEYKKMKTDDHNDDLCSKGMIHSILPDNITQTGMSLLKLYPDAINAFFKMLELKTYGESLHVKGSTPYVNISSFIKSFPEIRVDGLEFANSFMPWQRILDEYSLAKPTLFLSELIPTEELDEFVQTIGESIDSCIEMQLFESEYFMPLAQISLVSTMLHFLLQEQVVYICHQTNLSREEVLRHIFKSRGDSIFIKGGQLDLPFYFDFNYSSKSVSIPEYKEYEPVSTQEIASSMGFVRRLRRKSKVLNAVNRAHKTLTYRDEILKLAGKFHRKCHKFYVNYAKHVQRKRQIGSEKDVLLLNLDEIKRVVNDSFYMSISSLQSYRGSFHNRTKAQLTPYELYNADSRFIGRIMEEQYDNLVNVQEFDCFSFNATQEILGDVKRILDDNVHEGYRTSDDILCARAFPLQSLGFTTKIEEEYTKYSAKADDNSNETKGETPAIVKPKAIITDLAPIMSYVTEYSFIYDVPLYYGVRFSERAFDKKKVQLNPKSKEGKSSIEIK